MLLEGQQHLMEVTMCEMKYCKRGYGYPKVKKVEKKLEANMPKTNRVGKDDEEGQFNIPQDIRDLAKAQDRIRVSASTLVALMDEADEALNGDSNDAEHDALFSIREQLSDLFEGEGD